MQTAELFNDGQSQAVRLPDAFRFEGTEVCVLRDGNKVILFPQSTNSSWEKFFSMPTVDDDFCEAILDARKNSFYPERESL